MEAFRSEYVTENIIRIRDVMDVAMYLVIGKEKACLLDTGCGLGDLANYVNTLCDKPLIVVLTHGHFDHTGGAAAFADVYLHPKDEAVYQKHNAPAYRQSLYEQFPALSSLPIKDHQALRQTPFLPLHDEQCFDLNGIHVKMIEVPGHTQGMMMALIPEEKIMLFGDACGVSVLLFEDCSSTLSDYRASLQHVADTYRNDFCHVIRNHGTFTSQPDILDNVIACCDDILQHRDDHVATQVMGQDGYFIAKRVDERNERVDGIQGNIVYRSDKAR